MKVAAGLEPATVQLVAGRSSIELRHRQRAEASEVTASLAFCVRRIIKVRDLIDAWEDEEDAPKDE